MEAFYLYIGIGIEYNFSNNLCLLLGFSLIASFTSVVERNLLLGDLINMSSKDSWKWKNNVQEEKKVLSETHLIQHGLYNKSWF